MRLSSRLSIYSKSATVNSYGESELTSSHLRWIWAEELTIKQEELVRSSSVKTMDQYKFKARYNTWLTEEMEIVYDDGVFTIDSVEPTGHQLKQWLIIIATRQS